MKTFRGILLGAGLILSLHAGATTYYVNVSNSSPTAPFTDWTTAATNIQDAIDASTNGDLVLVTNGVYQFGGRVMAGNLTNRVALNMPITVQSVNGPWVTAILGVGATNGNGAVRCAWLTNNASLIGFTLTSGATRSSGDQVSLESGGGVWCASTNCLVGNCLIVSNTAYAYGGGVYSGTVSSSLIISNGSIINDGASYQSVLKNCTVVSNATPGVMNPLAMTNCIIYYNYGINCFSVSGSAFSHCCTTPALSGTGNITNAPQLFADGIHLASGSPCIGGGVNPAVGTDIFGSVWSNPPAIGCAEWQSSPFVTKPQIQVAGSPAGFTVGKSAFTGQSPFVFFWLKDGVPLQDDGHFSSTQTTNLTATGVSLADVGNYQFAVSNAFGVVTSAVVSLVIHCVDVAGTNPVAPYLNWATAATNIQDAIGASVANEVVLVTNGLYGVGGKSMDGVITNRVAIDKAILVQGVNGPSATTIQGAWDATTINGLGAIRCVWLTNNAVVSGFTLRSGATRSVTASPNQSMKGGGVYGVSNNASVYNCWIITNYASYIGGGAFQVTLNQCTLTGNHALGSGTVGSGVASAGSGGGAYGCNLTNCLLISNVADQSNGGGAENCNLKNCALTKNKAGLYGGGADSGSLVNCTVTGNGNITTSYSSYGGGAANAKLTNCLVYANYNVGSGPTNYTLCTISYSDTDPLPAGTGNLDVDPQLLADGVHLAATSPCLGAGTASVVSGTDIDSLAWGNPPAIGCDDFQPAPLVCAPPTYQVSIPAYVMTFNVIVAGQSPFAYFWSKDGVPIQDDGHYTNSGTANLVVNNLQSTDAGLYQVVVSNAMGVVTSSLVAVSVAYPPSIVTQPLFSRVVVGGSNNLSVGIAGITPFGYQWFTSSGRTATAYPIVVSGSISSVSMFDSGMGYVSTPQVHIVGGSGSGATAFAIILGGGVLGITRVNPGSGYSTAAPTVQIDPPPMTTTLLTGQTNATLSLSTAALTDRTNYFVVINNNYGSVTSATVYLTVFLPPQNFTALNVATGLQVNLTGTPGYPYIVQSTTNLAPLASWHPVRTNYADTYGNWQFVDTNLNAGQKFYRAVSQ